jgi:hypothetical protein
MWRGFRFSYWTADSDRFLEWLIYRCTHSLTQVDTKKETHTNTQSCITSWILLLCRYKTVHVLEQTNMGICFWIVGCFTENHVVSTEINIYLTIQDLRFSRQWLWRMPSSGMWRRLDLAWTDVSKERRFTQDLHDATSQKKTFFTSLTV